MSEREELCGQIDSLVVEFFAKLSELDAKKAELENVMADGFIQMSKTRYNMGGTRSIGSAMYDRSNMIATVNVLEERGSGDGDTGRTLFRLVNPADLEEGERGKEDKDAFDVTGISNVSTVADDGLRKRITAKAEEKSTPINEDILKMKNPSTEKPDGEDTIENLGKAVCDLKVSSDGMMELQNMESPVNSPGRSPTKASSSNDPIRWFGILVPQSLKLSQQRFKSSLDLVVEIANLQLEVGSMQSRFKSMIKLKQSMADRVNGKLSEKTPDSEE